MTVKSEPWLNIYDNLKVWEFVSTGIVLGTLQLSLVWLDSLPVTNLKEVNWYPREVFHIVFRKFANIYRRIRVSTFTC